MADISKDELKSLLNKYKRRIEKELDQPLQKSQKPIFSKEYKEFKKELIPSKLSLYERLCNSSENLIKIKPKPETEKKIQSFIEVSHLNITPTGAISFAIMAPLIFMLLGIIISSLLVEGIFFIVVFLFSGLMLIGVFSKIPSLIANNRRMKASNQMVLCIFYVVTYMRHTSNLENAINFASDHLNYPLNLDMKKILWDVETQKYSSIKESLDVYLETWREWNIEFVESFHLIESSLYESSEERRVTLLDKSLDVILDETYEKMLNYAHDLQSPITMLHMLGVVMPILGLVVLPLVVSFMEAVRWYHISVLYNFLLPMGVFYLAKNILSMRPTGYGDTNITEDNPALENNKTNVNIGPIKFNISPLYVGLFVGIILLIIGLFPIWINFIAPDFDIGFGGTDKNSVCGKTFCLLEYRLSKAENGPLYGKIIGPYGLGATIIGLAIPLSLGIGIGLYFKLKSKNVIKLREKSKKLEKEFASALFQLGNRLGDGIPAEIAFEKVAYSMKGTISGSFFEFVSINIKNLGMSVQDAIFNQKTGAIAYFPSNIIESSMKVLIVSVKKGSQTAASALINIARYIKEIHKVNERLKDLMAEIISSMKSQISFLTPVVAGIVIGITSMITTILSKLGGMFPQGGDAGAMGGASNLTNMFGDGIPAYHFQIVVGIYVVQVVYILTLVINGIENGSDKLNERYNLGVNLIRSTVLYTIVSLIVIIIFNFIAGQVLVNTI